VNNDYPDRVAFTLLTQILEEFCDLHGDKWQGQATDNACPMPTLDATLKKYQVPEEADKLMAIQKVRRPASSTSAVWSAKGLVA
jgi:hypothetical protein